jgi:hypothetical protein
MENEPNAEAIVTRAFSFICALILGMPWMLHHPRSSYANEFATSATGRKVLLKDDGTWTYADKETPSASQPSGDTADQTLRAHCLSEWTDDFRMRSYCERQQKEAVQALEMGRPQDISQDEFASVRRRCAGEWPTDFRMREYCERQQHNGIRELRRQ